jgi:hypothetical protein
LKFFVRGILIPLRTWRFIVAVVLVSITDLIVVIPNNGEILFENVGISIDVVWFGLNADILPSFSSPKGEAKYPTIIRVTGK